jgi:hypothetical protein
MGDCGAASRSSSNKPQGSATSTAASTNCHSTSPKADRKSIILSASSPVLAQPTQSESAKRVANVCPDLTSRVEGSLCPKIANDDEGEAWIEWQRGIETVLQRCQSEQLELRQALALQRSRNQQLAEEVSNASAYGLSDSAWRRRAEQEDLVLAQHQEWCQAYGRNLAGLDALLRMREQELNALRSIAS